MNARPCTWSSCGATNGVRLFNVGWRCPQHTAAALAGRPEPGQGVYCPPGMCLCHHAECPAKKAPPPAAPTTTAIDTQHVLTGKRSAHRRELVAARMNQTSHPTT